MPFSQLTQPQAPSAPNQRFRISEGQKKRVGELFSSGLSAKEISEALGLSLTSVYGSLKNLGIKPPRKSNSPTYNFSDLYIHIKAGGTIPSFAKSKKISKSAVDYQLRKKYGTASISNFMRKHNER